MPTIRDLLSEIESALEDYSYDLSKARKPSRTSDERLLLIRASSDSWRQLVAAQEMLEEITG